MEHLFKAFDKVGLSLKKPDRPFAGNSHIFGLDIRGDNFIAWVPDHVQASVSTKDKKLGQVILTVKEPRTIFTEEIHAFQRLPGDKVPREIKKGRQKKLLVERVTPDVTRHFLCGRDERQHPFIAQLQRGAPTITAAHESLKPPELKGLKIKGHGKNARVKGKRPSVHRQGEWFFKKATAEELEEIKDFPSRKKIPIESTRGNPHIADERIFVKGVIFVRGSVRHDEHETLKFPYWMRVFHNQETGAQVAGRTWVD